MCVPAKRAHVEHMRAFCQHTRMRFEPAHGDVLSTHTGGGKGRRVVVVVEWGRGGERGTGVLFSLFLSSPLFLLSLPALVVSPSSLSNNDNDHSSSRALSLCAHTRTLARSLFGRPVVEMGDVSVVVCVCLCLFVFGCVWLCLVVRACVSVCCVVVTVQKKKREKKICNFKKMSRERIYPHYGFE